MPTRIHYENSADLAPLQDKRVAIVGYGSQGHAHAQNLRDSGLDVVVGLRPNSSSWARAEADGLRVRTITEAVRESSIVMLLVPDTEHRAVFEQAIAGALSPGSALMFAHGFSVHFEEVRPPDSVDVSMIAPKAPGHVMRDLFVRGIGVPALMAVARDVSGRATQTALAYARGVGCLRAGVLETTFQEETETDLFGEQTCICGGVMSLIKMAFETLVEAGYQPEIAYFECMHEMKLIVDLMYQGGLRYMTHSISETAEYGAYTRGPRLVDERTRSEMKKILADIRSGAFAKEWIAEHGRGRPSLAAERAKTQEHPIEAVGQRLRSMMSWLPPPPT